MIGNVLYFNHLLQRKPMSDEKRSFIKKMNASASMTMDIERDY
jgi:hypothetical protein